MKQSFKLPDQIFSKKSDATEVTSFRSRYGLRKVSIYTEDSENFKYGVTRRYRPKVLHIMMICITLIFSTMCSSCSSFSNTEKIPEKDKTVISVIRFKDRSIGTKQYEPWRMGLPDMIMESLSVVPSFRVISREYLINNVLEEQKFQLLGATDPDSAVEMGNMLNARYMVIGSFSVFNNNLHINAKVLSVKTGELRYQTSARGVLNSFYKLQNRIAVDITRGLQITLTKDAEKKVRSSYGTRVVNASLANYKGEEKVEKITMLKSAKKEVDTRKKIQKLKTEAKASFKQALKHDKNYEKAKKNLGKIMLGVPMTI